jgi:glucan 1,3-beta-glucosidase
MTSSSVIWDGVPDDIANRGEHALMQYLGHGNGDWRFNQHRAEWITEADIKEIASFGLNTVRVPIGYWLPGFDNTGGSDWQTFAPGALSHLDDLIKNWANTHNVAVLISIHAAKGSQNGNDHSAAVDPGQTYWSQYPENVQNTLDLAVWLADRYRNDPAFLGIGLLNEPAGTTDDGILHQYYTNAYNAIRATGNDCVLTHAPLLYKQDPSTDQDFMAGASNAWEEWHKYLIWGYEGQNEDQILYGAVDGISSQIQQWHGNWMFIGEWSLATNPEAPFSDRNKFIQLGTRMIDALNQAHSGWTYWTWKVSYDESGFNAWSLRTLLREGAFPFTPVNQYKEFLQ